jgi:hypothetical protein
MPAGWHTEDLALAAIFVAVAALLVVLFVVSRRRWALVRQNNERGLRLAEEAVADRKRILGVLEEIKTILKDKRS